MAHLLDPEPVLYHAQQGGFALLDPSHLTLLVACLSAIMLLVRRYGRLPKSGTGSASPRRRQLLVQAGLAVGILAAKDVSYIALGLFEPLFWPLHICNLSEFVALAAACHSSDRVVRRANDLLFCWGISGCLAALLIPGWSGYCPAFSLASLCGFVEHTLVLACALCPLVGGDYQPDPRRMGPILALSVGCGLLFRLVNPLLGTNFFFVTNPAGAGWPGRWLLQTMGDPWFLAGYLALAVACWTLTYLLWWIAERRRKNRR